MSGVCVPLSVLVIGVDGVVSESAWQPGPDGGLLRLLQEVVGGSVDVVALDAETDMWVNDEGIYTEEVNPVASAVASHVRMQGLQPFYGAAVFTGSPDEDGVTTGLSVLRGAWLQHVAMAVNAATRAEITAWGEQFAAQFH